VADVIPLVLLAFGVVALLRPEVVAAADRRQKAAGTTRRPSDIETSETYYAVVRTAGIGLTLFELLFTLRSV